MDRSVGDLEKYETHQYDRAASRGATQNASDGKPSRPTAAVTNGQANTFQSQLHHRAFRWAPLVSPRNKNVRARPGFSRTQRIARDVARVQVAQVTEPGTQQALSVPAWLGHLKQLQELGLSHNQLSSVPESIWQLDRLQDLDLSHNQLSSVPESIWQLTWLQELNLSHNQLSPAIEPRRQVRRLVNLFGFASWLFSFVEWLGARIKRLRRAEPEPQCSIAAPGGDWESYEAYEIRP